MDVWREKRAHWITSMRPGQRLRREDGARIGSPRDYELELNVLQQEGLIEQTDQQVQLSLPGRVFRELARISRTQAGPFTLTELRSSRGFKALSDAEMQAALDHLIQQKIAVRISTSRTTKYDLV